eukprot:2317705-Amphidinium_carterae.1
MQRAAAENEETGEGLRPDPGAQGGQPPSEGLTPGSPLSLVTAEPGVSEEVLAAFESELGSNGGVVTVGMVLDLPVADVEETLGVVCLDTEDNAQGVAFVHWWSRPFAS